MTDFHPEADDYYERLGLQKDADHAAIRRAFKKCVMRFHPDRNPDDPTCEEQFKCCNEAYEVLSDPEKREIYDRYGEEGLRQGGGPRGPGGLFGGLFGGGLFGDGPMGGMGGMGGGHGHGPKKTPSIRRALQVSLEDVYNGRVRRIRVTRKRICASCHGKGASKPGAVEQCSECNGQGQVVYVQRMGPGFISKRVMPCQKCRGEGTIIDERFRCSQCQGECIVEEKKTLEVHVDKGMREGQKIEFEGEADERPGFRPGDIVFVLQIGEHERFRRDGLNLHMKKNINLSEALTGVEFLVEHLDSRVLLVKSKPGEVIQPACVRQIENEGMPRYRSPYEKGNLYIEFTVDFPKKIPRGVQERLIQMLPGKRDVRMPVGARKKGAIVDDVVLQEPTEARTDSARRREAYDSDDEDEEGRGRTVTCSLM